MSNDCTAAHECTCGGGALDSAPASVNGVALHHPGEMLSDDELRQRACTELLRQAAQQSGLLSPDDRPTADGICSEAASLAIENLLSRNIQSPEPDEQACQRHFAAHASRYQVGESVLTRHILFAVTDGTDVAALRRRAEATLLEVRSHDGSSDPFGAAARELSNCPSGQMGGELGWITAGECAPELAQAIFGRHEIGVLPTLIRSRYGLHVIQVCARTPGRALPYDEVRATIVTTLRNQAYVTALRQYLALLAGQADIHGVAMDAADTPLVQ